MTPGRLGMALAMTIGSLGWFGCGNDESGKDALDSSPEVPVETTEPEPPEPAVPEAEDPKEKPSLFSPLDEQHRKNLRDRKDEAKEIDARIEAAARKREQERAAEFEQRLEELHEQFVTHYEQEIVAVFEDHRRDLDERYLDQLRQTHQAVKKAGRTVLASKLVEEARRVKAGESPPPPEKEDAANPGLQILHDLRTWYAESRRNLGEARGASVENLTQTYRQNLQQWLENSRERQEELISRLLEQELERIQGSWWETTPTESE